MLNTHRLKKCFPLCELLLAVLLIFAGRLSSSPKHVLTPGSKGFNGAAALRDAKKATSFGERPSGSKEISQLREWIISTAKTTGGEVSEDRFTANTPAGPIAMANVIVKFPGTSGKAIVVTGHYDTKRIPMIQFVGANDGGSSTGFLIEFARSIAAMKHSDDIYIVFFDGEEAVRKEWAGTDNCYGSRHLAANWLADGTLRRVKALINIDMIGDKELDISNDENSSESLRSMVWKIASKLGYEKYFRHEAGAIDDDHKPFVDSGVNAIDIIDLDYGPNGSYWHTAADTIDKLSAHSFDVVGEVVLELVKELDQRT